MRQSSVAVLMIVMFGLGACTGWMWIAPPRVANRLAVVQTAELALSPTPPDGKPAEEMLAYFLGVTEHGVVVVLDSRTGRVWSGSVESPGRPRDASPLKPLYYKGVSDGQSAAESSR